MKFSCFLKLFRQNLMRYFIGITRVMSGSTVKAAHCGSVFATFWKWVPSSFYCARCRMNVRTTLIDICNNLLFFAVVVVTRSFYKDFGFKSNSMLDVSISSDTIFCIAFWTTFLLPYAPRLVNQHKINSLFYCWNFRDSVWIWCSGGIITNRLILHEFMSSIME